jgi:hypothetical protein
MHTIMAGKTFFKRETTNSILIFKGWQVYDGITGLFSINTVQVAGTVVIKTLCYLSVNWVGTHLKKKYIFLPGDLYLELKRALKTLFRFSTSP